MYQLLLVVHVLIATVVIGLVLIQHGKGADIGAAFGSGASNTVFGSQGTGGFLFKLTGGSSSCDKSWRKRAVRLPAQQDSSGQARKQPQRFTGLRN